MNTRRVLTLSLFSSFFSDTAEYHKRHSSTTNAQQKTTETTRSTSCVVGVFPSPSYPTVKMPLLGHRTCPHGAPSQMPSLLCSTSREWQLRPRTCTCQLAQENSGLLRPSTTHLGCQNHQLGSAVGTNQFWADSGFFAPGHLQGDTVMLSSTESRPTVCMQGTDQRRVYCKLGSSQRQTIHNHFKSSRIRDRHIQVHVPHQHVGADSSSCLPAYPGSHTLQSEATPPQHSRSCTSCTMMATEVKWTATSAVAHRQGESLSETTPETRKRWGESWSHGWSEPLSVPLLLQHLHAPVQASW